MQTAIRAAIMRTCVIAIILGTAIRAQVINVSGSGAALQIAAASAPNGATLIVAPGVYDAFALNSKILTIYAPQRAVVRGGVVMQGHISRLTLRGFDLVSQFVGYPIAGTIWAQGDLRVEDCTCEGITVDSLVRAVVVISRTTVIHPWFEALRLECCDATITDSTFESGTVGGSVTPAMTISGSSVRFERVSATGAPGTTNGGRALVAGNGGCNQTPSILTLADCTLSAGMNGTEAIQAHATTSLTMSQVTVNGTTSGPSTVASLATAQFTAGGWAVGGTTPIELHDNANSLGTLILAQEAYAFSTPLIGEQLFVGYTANYLLWDFGISDASGNLAFNVAVPNTPALRHKPLFATGIFLSSTPWRATATIGGLIE